MKTLTLTTVLLTLLFSCKDIDSPELTSITGQRFASFEAMTSEEDTLYQIVHFATDTEMEYFQAVNYTDIIYPTYHHHSYSIDDVEIIIHTDTLDHVAQLSGDQLTVFDRTFTRYLKP